MLNIKSTRYMGYRVLLEGTESCQSIATVAPIVVTLMKEVVTTACTGMGNHPAV